MEEISNKLDNHETRIKELEENRRQSEMKFLQLESKVDTINMGVMEVKNTVLEEGKERRKESDKLLKHVLDNDSHSRKHKRNIEMKRQDYVWRWITRATVAGGLIYFIVELVLKKLLGVI